MSVAVPAHDAAAGMSADDRCDLRDLVARYVFVMDERLTDRYDEVFTEDVTFDLTDLGGGVTYGIAALRAGVGTSGTAPAAHLTTDVLLEERDDGAVRLVCRGLGVSGNGKVGAVTYVDEAVRTPAGWRLRARAAYLRRLPP